MQIELSWTLFSAYPTEMSSKPNITSELKEIL